MRLNGTLKWSVGIAVLVSIVFFWLAFLNRSELGQKEKWALLQRVEYENREVLMHSRGRPILLVRTDSQSYSVLGLPSSDGGAKYVWILLDDGSETGSSVKKIPDNVDFYLSCNYISELKAKVDVASAVMNLLRSRCHHG